MGHSLHHETRSDLLLLLSRQLCVAITVASCYILFILQAACLANTNLKKSTIRTCFLVSYVLVHFGYTCVLYIRKHPINVMVIGLRALQ